MAKKKILIVDDDAALATEVKLTLEQTGRFEVHCETKGSRSLETAQTYKPDVILMDLIMPDMSGTEATNRLKQDPSTSAIPIVFFTILVSRSEIEAKNSMIGGNYFIAKPSTIDEVVECIDRALDYPESRSAA